MNRSRLTEYALIGIPPPPPRFTTSEWYLNNVYRNRVCLDQQQLSDSILKECDKERDEIQEIVKQNKKDTDHNIKQKIEDINFLRAEIQKQRKDVCEELDALLLYMERLTDARNFLREKGDAICKKCILLREGRLGIDLVVDDVERELRKEIDVIEGAQMLLTRAHEQANEQVRILRSKIYFIDRDLEDKDAALKIDGHNLTLNENSLNLSLYHGFADLDLANITKEEWEAKSWKNIEDAAKEINSARHLRTFIDTLLRQAIDDLWTQYNLVQLAFAKRIQETRDAKHKLEMSLSEVQRQINDMTRNITRLEIAISEKEGYMACAHTRLGNRAQRPGAELCKDLVSSALVYEVDNVRICVAKLQHRLAEAQASLRYLLKIQMQLQEDINVKTNTLKIDEVDCMTLRESMDYHSF